MRFTIAWCFVLFVSCKGGDDDVDDDGDGFAANEDCDDADPAVNPDADEIWYDAVDQNCDASDDARLAFERIPQSTKGSDPAGPRFGRDGDVVSVDLVFPNDGIDTSARLRATYEAETGDPIGDSYQVLDGELGFELGRTLDAEGVEGTEGVVAASIVTDEGNLRAALIRFDEDGGWQWGGHGPGDTVEHYLDMALHEDGDVLGIVGCGPDQLTWLSGTLVDYEELTYEWAAADVAGTSCEVSGSEVRVLDEDGTVTSYTADGEELVPDETWRNVVDLAWDEQGFLLVKDEGLVFEHGRKEDELPTSEIAVRARFDVSPDDQLYVVYADEDGDLFLLYGPLDGPLQESFLDDRLANDDLDVEVTRDVVFVGARTGDDGWIAAVERSDIEP